MIVHVRTQKGKGYRPAETDQISFHGAALPPMTVPTGRRARPAGRGPPERRPDGLGGRGGSQVTTGHQAEAGAPPSASVMADRRTPAHNSEGAAQPPAAQAADA